MYVVTGASGNTGSAVASALLDRGERVRVVVRSDEKGDRWRSKGAEVAITSFDDQAGLRQALQGADSAYFMVPPNIKTNDQDAWYTSFAQVFREVLSAVPLPHAVVLSAWGANQPRPFHQLYSMERALQDCATPITFIRASYFMENLQQVMPVIQSQSVIPSFIDPDIGIPMVACRDIGELVAEIMTGRSPQGTNAIDLTGPKYYSFNDAARAFSVTLEKPIKAVRIPDDQVVSTVIGWGASPETAEFFKEMYNMFERGELKPEGGSVPIRRGSTQLEDQVRELVTAGNPAYLG